MANQIYPKGRQAFAQGDIDWDGDDIRLVLLDNTYTFDLAHNALDDIAGGSVVATSGAFTGKDSTDGICDAADVVVPTVSGDVITQVVVYKHTGTPSTSTLLLYFDATAASVLIALTPDGTGVRVRWSNGPNKIFKL